MRVKLLGLIGAMTLMLAACGSTTTANTPGSSAAPTATIAPTNTPAASADLPLHTATATVSGASKTILTNAKGLTLYYRTSDTPTSVCSGGCASIWPPVLSPSGAPTSADQLTGKLDVLNDANGAQVTYNGHPLYAFTGDSKAGDTTGNGFGGIWFAATPDLAAPSANGTPQATPCRNYYNCG